MSTTVAVNHYQIDKLTSKNFSVWKFRIQMVLKAHTEEYCWDKNGRPEGKSNGNQTERGYLAQDSSEVQLLF